MQGKFLPKTGKNINRKTYPSILKERVCFLFLDFFGKEKMNKTKVESKLLIYQKYEETIKNSYIDENDNLTILSSELENIEDFKNCDIYIDEFVGFTKQEYNILRMLFSILFSCHITNLKKYYILNIFDKQKLLKLKFYHFHKHL